MHPPVLRCAGHMWDVTRPRSSARASPRVAASGPTCAVMVCKTAPDSFAPSRRIPGSLELRARIRALTGTNSRPELADLLYVGQLLIVAWWVSRELR
jgi:hypothetical protein